MRQLATIFVVVEVLISVNGFTPSVVPQKGKPPKAFVPGRRCFTRVGISFIPNDDQPIEPDDDEEEDDEEEIIDPYRESASSEFLEDEEDSDSSALSLPVGTSNLDWGGEYGKLSQRIEDVETGESQRPSKALFRLMTSETPNQTIGNFLKTANPQVVGAMSGAVSSLLGGLSSPANGIEMIVKTTGDKIGNLCFQLQMTGYMFRNAEYVMALKDLMNLKGGATLEDYKAAFDRVDRDKSGYIDTEEIEALLADVYDGDVPDFEIDSFMKFFDSNNDGKISWQEFERGLGNISEQSAANSIARSAGLLPTSDDIPDDDDVPEISSRVSGTVEIELEDGQVIEVEANEYMDSLKREADELREALRQEMSAVGSGDMTPVGNSVAADPQSQMGDGIASYIASRKDDLQSMTNSVQPEIMETMRMLVDFVLKGGNPRKKDVPSDQVEMELPGSAFQQLALWQLVLGYKLREAEATGDYLKLLE